MPTEIQDTRLTIKIDNKNPVELMDLTKSLVSLGSNFQRYAGNYGNSAETREAKLYVKEVRTGSIIIELMEFASIGMIPFLENVNVILDFTGHLNKVFKYFLKGEGEKPEMQTNDYREISGIVSPIAKDQGSQILFNTTINGNVVLDFNLKSTEGNAIQNIFKRELEELSKSETQPETREHVLLSWYQARNDPKSKAGNKGIIDELSPKPMNITFASDEIQDELLHGSTNPFNAVFEVDIRVQTVNGEAKAYQITKIHQFFEQE